jgi:hypothetical protein
MHGISQHRSSRSWILAGAFLALLSFAAGRAHAQLYAAPASIVPYAYPGGYQVNAYGQPYRYVQPYSYTSPYAYVPTYAYGQPYVGSYSYPAAVPSVAPVYGYNSYTVGSSPTVAGYRYLDDYAAGRHLPLAKPWMAPLR